MNSFPLDAVIQTSGLQALINLGTMEKEMKRLGFYGACQRILQATADFPLDYNIQKFGIGALANLISEEGCRKKIGSLGGCNRVVAAMKAFPLDHDVQLWAFHALKGLVADNSFDTSVLVGRDACEVVLGALGRFPTARELQYQGCWAVRNILSVASERGTMKAWISAGVKGRMEVAMAVFPSDGELRACASEAILRIVQNENEGNTTEGRDESGFTGGRATVVRPPRLIHLAFGKTIFHVKIVGCFLKGHGEKTVLKVAGAISQLLGVLEFVGLVLLKALRLILTVIYVYFMYFIVR